MTEPSDEGIGEAVFCHCRKSIDEVSLAHYLSCGTDAYFTADEAQGFVDRVAERVERGLSAVSSQEEKKEGETDD